jgi:serine/threonine protein kinase
MMKIYAGPNASVLQTQCGTPNYMAQELFDGNPYNGPPVDVFALGAVLFLVRFGRFGFLLQGDTHYRKLMKNPELAMKQKKLECDPCLLELIVGMLHPDATKRFTL